MTIKIHNYKWKVKFVPDCALDGTVCLGLTEYLKQTIKIRKGMSKEMTKATVIHELVHAFLFCYGLTAEAYDEEKMCEFFGTHADEIMSLTEKIMRGITWTQNRPKRGRLLTKAEDPAQI